ncbi:MAG TPA: hypothetical protein VK599_00025 [Streptosporangiaceae bacterium]|nr:hypothetical protein [Streptosporangiaceae bacterium]
MTIIATESTTADLEARQVMAAFRQALQQANETGSATVGFRNSSVDATGNESAETGYDITIVRIG